MHYEQTLRHSDLHCRQANTRCGIHRLKHVADEFLQIVAKLSDRFTRTIEYRIWPLYDFP